MVFAAVAAGLIAIAGCALLLVFRDAAGHRALAISAGVALVAQVAAFAIVWLGRGRYVMAAWALGMLVRFIVLGAYGLLGVRAWGLAPTAALLSLVVFFVVSTFAEPWLLRS
jgi:hypothetical protein